jgi:hypothetical protein
MRLSICEIEEAAARSDQTPGTHFKALAASDRNQLQKAPVKLRGAAYPLLDLRPDAPFPPVG